jgi:hypothetical protein
MLKRTFVKLFALVMGASLLTGCISDSYLLDSYTAGPKATLSSRSAAITHVNTLTYNHGDAKPAMEAYRVRTQQRGWTARETKSWETAIANIMMGESGFCPNLLRGATLKSAKGCVIRNQGPNSDAGFGQIVLRYSPWLCAQEKLCSKWDIIHNPWNSMTALIALIEKNGTFPWCYNSWARSYHRIACNNPGLNVADHPMK